MPTNLPTASERSPGAAEDPVILLSGVAVRYRVPQERIPSLKEFAIRFLKRKLHFKEFWALRGVDLSIRPGEIVGIIGPNGAGKSTLLKVIARVLRPTAGRVRLRGRISPLLELGAGFDYELTGRENILLNGTLLGYSQKHILRRFDRVVEFAGLEDFIDAPLRTYSSGMVARLGFAIATDVQPDILIVDEILAVGDADFQRKSLDRINSFRARGATILLVSHSLEAIQSLCTRAIWIEKGRIAVAGHADSVVRSYLGRELQRETDRLLESGSAQPPAADSAHPLALRRAWFSDEQGRKKVIFETGEYFQLCLEYHCREAVRDPVFGMAIHRQDGLHICGPNTAFAGLATGTVRGTGQVTYTVPHLPLLEGLYQVSVAAVNHDDSITFDYHDRAYSFRVVNSPVKNLERYGLLSLGGHWETRPVGPPLPQENRSPEKFR